MDFLKPYSELIALASLLVSILAAFVAGRSAIKVEAVRQQFALRQTRIAALRAFQEFMKDNFLKMDALIPDNKGKMTHEQSLAAAGYLREVNNRYREISYAFSNESQELLNNTLSFIEREAHTDAAFDQLQALPALYQSRISQDLGVLFT